MATAEQMKSLVKAYADCNDEKFKTVVLQIAAHEARLGHDNLARELKKQIDRIGNKRANIVQLTSTNPMLSLSMPSHDLSELIVSEDIGDKIQRILNEYRNRNKLISYGLTNRRKILIEGNPGTGKTLTASIIASELSLPLYTVQMDKLVTKFMGETSAKLRQVFDSIESNVGVYLFDEFDAIGADRSLDNEVGEMRRILNSFLQFIEQDGSESIIIAATNNQKLLDQALFRRFDDVLHYTLPTQIEIKRLLEYKIKSYDEYFMIPRDVVKAAEGLSHAEIARVCDDAIKNSILNDEPITDKMMVSLLNERQNVYSCKEA
ncbi:MAG: ATP-binding protein [Eubacterium sp.]|jgi:SpoVK/Ycf46/Vps4 family AAA+-type ATPase|nr:ATP-binding protein [Eubacterium sp.]